MRVMSNAVYLVLRHYILNKLLGVPTDLRFPRQETSDAGILGGVFYFTSN